MQQSSDVPCQLCSADGWLLGMRPISRDRVLGVNEALEATDVEVEDGELVLGEDVSAGLLLDASADVADGRFEEIVDGRIEVAFGVASNVNGALVTESAYPVNVCIVVATHDVVVVG